MVTQAAAAREEQFFLRGDGATRVCRGQLSEPLSSVLELSSVRMLATMGSALMLDRLLRLLVFFLVARFVSIRGFEGVVFWTFLDSGSVPFVVY